MAKKVSKRTHNLGEITSEFGLNKEGEQLAEYETTGRFIVVFKEESSDISKMRKILEQTAGIKNMISSADYNNAVISSEDLNSGEVIHFDKLGTAIVSGEDAVKALTASTADTNSPVLTISPEYIGYLASSMPFPDAKLGYLKGYRDAVNNLYDNLILHESAEDEAAGIASKIQDTSRYTWGLQATRVDTSRYTGQGIKVAVLDTGMDFSHPDFRGRRIVSESFSGVSVDDVHGHGTHCVGTACGPLRPVTGVRRYGVASDAEIYVGKIFNNASRPQAPAGNVHAALNWAITNNCNIASISIEVRLDYPDTSYNVILQRALNSGMLVVTAAGNTASRPSNPGFVVQPANSDAALAVAAIDNRLAIASFSGRSSQVTGEGGKVNIAGPGVQIYSSFPVGKHHFIDGTSMATPHVAGIAALWAQATRESGATLWNRLERTALRLNISSIDVGSGLVQAPQ